MENTENQQEENQNWLREIAQKSWEPELLVSGAAIYLTSNLPTWIDHLDEYYTVDMLIDINSPTSILPLLAFSFLKLMSYLLLSAFVCHFVMRAFWVATVGLMSVFPQDINYDNLPTYSDYFKTHIKLRLGSLQDYVNRLDKTCSSLLSIAFLVAITLFGISFTYFIGFSLLQIASFLIPQENKVHYEQIMYYIFLGMIVLVGSAGAILNIPALKKNPKVAKLQFKISIFVSSLFFPFISDALQRISLVFLSNVPRKKYYTGVIVFSVVFIVLLPFTFKSGILIDGLLKNRTFYSEGTPTKEIDNDYYEDMRNPHESVLRVSIPSQTIDGNFLKIFLSYPKRLDKQLEKMCTTLSVADSLDTKQANEQKDTHSLACLDKFFTISINDSIYPKELFFHKHNTTNELGLLTYLPTKNLQEGKNILKVVRFHSDSTKADRNTYVVPFWFVNN
jgi:hypothetical protein